jgi:hypothetical protein
MFIFDRSFMPIAAGLGTAFLFVFLDRLSQPPGESPEAILQPLQTAQLVDRVSPRLSSLAVRGDSTPSCASAAASTGPLARSSRIALEQLSHRRLDRSLACLPATETSTPTGARRPS